MKTKTLFIATLLVAIFQIFIPTSFASEEDPIGGWALVDQDGNVLGVHVCARSVCGDPNSEFSRLVLKPGQKYVLQTKADTHSGNVAGWGSGATYDPATDTFNLPGGGTIKSGSNIEDAIFPTPSASPSEPMPQQPISEDTNLDQGLTPEIVITLSCVRERQDNSVGICYSSTRPLDGLIGS